MLLTSIHLLSSLRHAGASTTCGCVKVPGLYSLRVLRVDATHGHTWLRGLPSTRRPDAIRLVSSSASASMERCPGQPIPSPNWSFGTDADNLTPDLGAKTPKSFSVGISAERLLSTLEQKAHVGVLYKLFVLYMTYVVDRNP
ncbi:hypothetical protein F4678DRAFT_184634 [Xylaria arbuscula]|nr:hypothetical protein F4678DRAFT_184634 [Xylaria arbuscula]